MNKDIIRQIILEKRNNGLNLTQQEKRNALKHFSNEEILCMRAPIFNHKSCFKSVKSLSSNELINYRPIALNQIPEVQSPSKIEVIAKLPPEELVQEPDKEPEFVYGDFNF